MPTPDNPLITIIGEKCRMCYACVRECPAKAIQVVGRPGKRHPDPLYRLRELPARVQSARQAGP